MAFDDQEMAVLSQLVYKNHEFPKQGSVRLSDILNNRQYSDYLKKNLKQDYYPAINQLQNKAQNGDYRIVLNTNDNKTGFAAMAIADPDREVTVVCRGTDGFRMDKESVKDIVHGDAGLIAGSGRTEQHREMEKFTAKLRKKGYGGFRFTGHSLGGNLAMYGAVALAGTGLVKAVTTFNAPQFNDAFVSANGAAIRSVEGVTTQYQNEYDVVSSVNGDNVFGDVVVVSTADGNTNPLDFEDHYLSGMRVREGAFSTAGVKKTPNDTALRLGRQMVYRPFPIRLGLIVTAVVRSSSVAAAVTQSLQSFLNTAFSGGDAYVQANPYISINTDQMARYAARLDRVVQRAGELDARMNRYYWSLAIEWDATAAIIRLGQLLTSNMLLKYSYRLSQCAGCLKETAADFDRTETEIRRLQ